MNPGSLTAFLTIMQYCFCKDDRGRECGRDDTIFTKIFSLPLSTQIIFPCFLYTWNKLYDWILANGMRQELMWVCFPYVFFPQGWLTREGHEDLEEGRAVRWNDQVGGFLNRNSLMGLWCEWEITLILLHYYNFSYWVKFLIYPRKINPDSNVRTSPIPTSMGWIFLPGGGF